MKTYFSGLLPRKPAGEGPSQADIYVLSLITLADVFQTRSADAFLTSTQMKPMPLGRDAPRSANSGPGAQRQAHTWALLQGHA